MNDRFLPYIMRLSVERLHNRWRVQGVLPASCRAHAVALARLIPGAWHRYASVILEGEALLWFVAREAPRLVPAVRAVVEVAPGKGHPWTEDLCSRQHKAVHKLAEAWRGLYEAELPPLDLGLLRPDEYRPARAPPPAPAPRQEI